MTDEEIIEVSKNSKSSITAAITLGIKYETYKKHAKRLGCFIERQDRLTQKEYLDKVNKVNPNIEVLEEYINIKTKIAVAPPKIPVSISLLSLTVGGVSS